METTNDIQTSFHPENNNPNKRTGISFYSLSNKRENLIT